MSEYTHIGWSHSDARLKSVAMASRGKATTIKIELEVQDDWAVASIMAALKEAQAKEREQAKSDANAVRAVARLLDRPQRARLAHSPTPMLALPAPTRAQVE